jgi:hypothetical protein
MVDQPDIREAACAIRFYLPELLDEDAAADLDGALARLLDEGAGEERLVDELERRDETAEWAAAFLEHGIPPEFAVVDERAYAEAPGYGEPVGLTKFACPSGDFVWYRHSVGQQPPTCPTHGVVVERVGTA